MQFSIFLFCIKSGSVYFLITTVQLYLLITDTTLCSATIKEIITHQLDRIHSQLSQNKCVIFFNTKIVYLCNFLPPQNKVRKTRQHKYHDRVSKRDFELRGPLAMFFICVIADMCICH